MSISTPIRGKAFGWQHPSAQVDDPGNPRYSSGLAVGEFIWTLPLRIRLWDGLFSATSTPRYAVSLPRVGRVWWAGLVAGLARAQGPGGVARRLVGAG